MVGTASYCQPVFWLLLQLASLWLCESRTIDTCFMQKSVRKHAPVVPTSRACSSLVNQGTFFTVDVDVGTPGQPFSLVADTGSNTLIVPSCACQQAGSCSTDDRCFVGTNRSTTFAIPGGADKPQGIYLAFGSGNIAGVVVQDVARIGELQAYLKKGLLLMTDKALNFAGSFEGILGLGLPNHEELAGVYNQGAADAGGQADVIREIIKRIKDMEGSSEASADAEPAEAVYLSSNATEVPDKERDGVQPTHTSQPPGFLEQAGVGRFSMCFNYNADGVLRLGTPPAPGALGSIGKTHWGLGLHGVSVGNTSVPVRICSPSDMKPGQETPCGAIPDSGTTFIMAPADHVSAVLSTVCDQWPRCRENHTAMVEAAKAASEAAERTYGFDPFGISPQSKEEILQILLMDCERWMDDSEGLLELPSLEFHVKGRDGTGQVLSLPPRAYIMQSNLSASQAMMMNITGGMQKTCYPAMGAMDYTTAEHGPVWILGTPLFYEFTVGYDMHATPPSISFTSVEAEPCGSCSKKAGLLDTASSSKSMKRPRWITGSPRLPTSIDVNRPL